MRKRALYLVLTCIGAVVPMFAFLPWVAEHGLNLHRMLAELFANRVSTFFALDLLITAMVVAVFAKSESPRTKRTWLPILVMLLRMVSAGLPLSLFLREKEQSPGAATH